MRITKYSYYKAVKLLLSEAYRIIQGQCSAVQCRAGQGAEKLGLMVFLIIVSALPSHANNATLASQLSETRGAHSSIVCWRQGLYWFYSRGCLKPIFEKKKKQKKQSTLSAYQKCASYIPCSNAKRTSVSMLNHHANPRLSHAFYHPKLLLPIFIHLFIHLKRFHSPPLSPCPDSPLRLLSRRLLAPQSALPNPLPP